MTCLTPSIALVCNKVQGICRVISGYAIPALFVLARVIRQHHINRWSGANLVLINPPHLRYNVGPIHYPMPLCLLN